MRKRTDLDRCGRIFKTALIIINVVFLILGIGVMASGIYITADRLFFTSPVYGIPIILGASYFFLSAGVLLVIISFIGCLASIYEKRSLLFLYAAAMCVVFMLAFTSAALAIVFRSWVREQVVTHMTTTIQKTYGVNLNNSWNAWVTKSWDYAQQRWYCCGVRNNSWGTYRSSEWFASQPGIPDSTRAYVPPSCCKKNQYGQYNDLDKCQNFKQGPPAKVSGPFNECLFYWGCYEAGMDALYSISAYFTAVGLIVSLFMLAGITISLNLYRRV